MRSSTAWRIAAMAPGRSRRSTRTDEVADRPAAIVDARTAAANSSTSAGLNDNVRSAPFQRQNMASPRCTAWRLRAAARLPISRSASLSADSSAERRRVSSISPSRICVTPPSSRAGTQDAPIFSNKRQHRAARRFDGIAEAADDGERLGLLDAAQIDQRGPGEAAEIAAFRALAPPRCHACQPSRLASRDSSSR